MPYIFDVVEKDNRGLLYADDRDQMLQIGTWLNERADVTGLTAKVRQASEHNGIMEYVDEVDVLDEDSVDFTDFLVEQFKEFRQHLH